MDYYKFGNLICSMRESHNLTQKEFADILGVSDKAVSKWENGQALPRMETLEKIANILGTSVEEIIVLSKENVKRVLIVNSFGSLLNIKIDDEIIMLKTFENKWALIDLTKSEHAVTVYGEMNLEDIIDETKESDNLFVQKSIKSVAKWATKKINKFVVRTKCQYILTDIRDCEKIEVENEVFSDEDVFGIIESPIFTYPKLNCSCKVKLSHAECVNKAEVYSSFKRYNLIGDALLSIPSALIFYPFKKLYIKRILKPSILKKYILKSDYFIEKENSYDSKSNHPIIKAICSLFLCIILFIGIKNGYNIINVELKKPYLISSDFSMITYGREKYVRIDELPKDAIAEMTLGTECWFNARIDGLSKIEQYHGSNKVCEYKDKENRTYLWLMRDYDDSSINIETGEFKDYNDFSEHYVYILQN